MKKILFAILVLGMFALGVGNIKVSAESAEESVYVSISITYIDFEEDVAVSATHLVIARYIGHEPTEQISTVFEFEVVENIVGNTDNRIFVYMEAMEWTVHSDGSREFELPRNFVLTPGTDYLLVLQQLGRTAYSKTHEIAFSFIQSTVIDLDTPANSMPLLSLPWILPGLNFDEGGDSREDIISYFTGLMRDNPPPVNNVIMSEAIEDIITGSPYVLVVEINEPYLPEGRVFSRMSTGFYNATVVNALKGDLYIGQQIRIMFFVGTVFTGEQHIVAIANRGRWFEFTSPHSLLPMDQLDEIKEILADTVQVTFDLHGGEATAGNAAHFAPQTITVGNLATRPLSNPTRTGFTFVDWYTALTGGAPFNFTTPIAEDTILHARWVAGQPAEQLPTQPPTSLPPIPPPPPPGSPLPSSSTPYIPWQPHPLHAQLPTPPTGDPAYLVYGNDPSTDAPQNILIFVVGNTQYLLNDQIRTAHGTPFIDPATDRMMIPLRTLSEALGINVEWDSANRAALVHLSTGTLAIPANDMLPDGMGSVIIVNDRIFVPLRFVMYAYDADVEWDSVGRAAVITW